MRRALMVLALLAGGCNSIVGIKDVVAAAPDGGTPDGPLCKVVDDFPLLNANNLVQGALLTRGTGTNPTTFFSMPLDANRESDLFVLSLYPNMGSLQGGLMAKTYNIGVEDSTFRSCGICAFIGVDVFIEDGMLKAQQYYLASAGKVEFSEVQSKLKAKLTNVTLRHVLLQGQETVEAGDGCDTTIGTLNIDMNFPAPDGGVPDASGPDAGTVAISGLQSDFYVPITGADVPAPRDLRAIPIQAFFDTGTGYISFNGSGDEFGNYSVGGVPPGKWTVRVGDVYFVTDKLYTQLGETYSGRPDKVRPPSGTTGFNMNISNAEMVTDTTLFEVYIPTQNVWGDNFDEDLGATSFTSPCYVPYLIKSSDPVYVSEISLRTAPSTHAYRALSRFVAIPSFTSVDGSLFNTGNLAFTTVPENKTVTIDWKRTQFQNAASLVNPGAAYDSDELSISPLPGRPKTDYWNTAAPRVFYSSPAGTSDINYGALTYGDPYDASWERWVEDAVYFDVDYTASGATNSVTMNGLVFQRMQLTPAMTIAPVVMPVTSPMIGGKGAFAAGIMDVGTTPVVSWTKNTTGNANGFTVYVYELTKNNADSKATQKAQIFTADQSVRIPPGLLEAGRTFFLIIRAWQTPNADFKYNPLRRGLPDAAADVLTNTFTP